MFEEEKTLCLESGLGLQGGCGPGAWEVVLRSHQKTGGGGGAPAVWDAAAGRAVLPVLLVEEPIHPSLLGNPQVCLSPAVVVTTCQGLLASLVAGASLL